MTDLTSIPATTLDSNYSTTKILIELFDDKFKLDKKQEIGINSDFKANYFVSKIKNSYLVDELGNASKAFTFLAHVKTKMNDGGLRKKGYFKFSYKYIDINNDNGKKGWFVVNNSDDLVIPVEMPYELISMPRLPLITIITVVYNGVKYIEKTIQNVISQNYLNVEYIIIDGESDDGTLDIIKKYEDKIDYWLSENDKGIYDAMNKGIDLANGKWICFMNSGDRFWDANVIEKVFEKEYKDSGVIYGDHVAVYGKQKIVCKPKEISEIYKHMCFSHQSSFINTSLMKSLKYNTDFKIAGDYEFFLRCYYKKQIKFDYAKILISCVQAEMGMSYDNILLSLCENFKANWLLNTKPKSILVKYYLLRFFYLFIVIIFKIKYLSKLKGFIRSLRFQEIKEYE